MRWSRRVGVTVTAACIAAAGLTAGVVAARQGNQVPQPWEVSACYRVTILDPEQQHTIRVLEAPRGAWVRVQGDPGLPRVPGANNRTPVWLNTASVFTLQQVECSTMPRE